MDEQSRPPAPPEPNLPRRHFHLTLALIILFPANVIAGWTLAILDVLKGYSSRAQLTWMRLFVALVVVDALMLGSALWAGPRLEEVLKSASGETQRPKIGVAFEAETVLKVREVVPDRPGARAGLQIGDVVEKIDGTPVATMKALADALQAKKEGEPRTLAVLRGGTRLDLLVIPETPPTRGLFDVEKSAEGFSLLGALLQFAPALLLVAIYAGWARFRSPQRVPLWSGFLIALIGSMGTSAGILLLIAQRNGGMSTGHQLIAALVQSALMLGLTAAARKWLSPDVPSPPATLSPVRAGFQGLLYLISGMIRIYILVVTLMFALAPEVELGDPLVKVMQEVRFGIPGGVLLFLSLAVLAPLAEESLFRGFLLPRLVKQWGELPALAASSLLFALLHLRDGPFVLLIFLWGWIFGWVRLRSGNIAASTALHMLVNGWAATMMLLT